MMQRLQTSFGNPYKFWRGGGIQYDFMSCQLHSIFLHKLLQCMYPTACYVAML